MPKTSDFDNFKYKIYKITNKITLEAYVGYTKYVGKRISEHLGHTDKNGSNLLRNAVDIFGEDAFMWAIIDGANTLEEVMEKEKLYIDRFRTLMPMGYNLSSGGVRGYTRYEWTYNQKANVSGSNNSRSKLTESQVVEILCDPRTRKEIARDYGVGLMTISDIKNRKKWTHVPLPDGYVPLKGNKRN